MRGKRGTTPLVVTVLVVIMLVAITVIGMFMFSLKEGDSTGKADRLCEFSNEAAGAGGAIYNVLPSGAKPISGICPTQIVRIDPENWLNCDNEIIKSRLSDKAGALTKCATQQVANLVSRCWKMNGEGLLDTGSRVCFSTVIQSTDVDLFEAPEDVFKYTQELVNTEFAEAGYCEENGMNFKSNGYYAYPPGFSSFDECTFSQAEIENQLLNRLSRSAIKDYYISSSIGSIQLCFSVDDYDQDGIIDSEDEDIDGDGRLNDDIEELSPYGDASVAEQLFNQMYPLPQPLNEAQVTAILQSRPGFQLDLEITETFEGEETSILCSDVPSNIAEWLGKLAVEDSEIKIINDNILALQPKEFAETDPFNAAVGSAQTGSYGLPEIGEITHKALTSLMHTTVNPSTKQYYCENTPCSPNTLKFQEGFTIEPWVRFEVAFCDDLDEFGSGIGGSTVCDKDKLLLASVGGSITHLSSPYPSYCKFFDFQIGPINSNNEIGEACEGIASIFD